jgi:hypothetical protein
MGDAQGTVASVDDGGQVYGSVLSAHYQGSAARHSTEHDQRLPHTSTLGEPHLGKSHHHASSSDKNVPRNSKGRLWVARNAFFWSGRRYSAIDEKGHKATCYSFDEGLCQLHAKRDVVGRDVQSLSFFKVETIFLVILNMVKHKE